MSKSQANELLQKLVEDINKVWAGRNSTLTATKVYERLKEIVKEYEKEE